MIPGAGRAWRLVAWLWGPWLIAALNAPSHAQTAPQAPPAPAPTYQDRYIAGGTLSPELSTEGYGTSETGGLARSIRIDGVVSVLDQQGPDAPPPHARERCDRGHAMGHRVLRRLVGRRG